MNTYMQNISDAKLEIALLVLATNRRVNHGKQVNRSKIPVCCPCARLSILLHVP